MFRDLVVVRGSEAMAPREPVPLTLPPMVTESDDDADSPDDHDTDQAAGNADDLQPFERGPEITEIR